MLIERKRFHFPRIVFDEYTEQCLWVTCSHNKWDYFQKEKVLILVKWDDHFWMSLCPNYSSNLEFPVTFVAIFREIGEMHRKQAILILSNPNKMFSSWQRNVSKSSVEHILFSSKVVFVVPIWIGSPAFFQLSLFLCVDHRYFVFFFCCLNLLVLCMVYKIRPKLCSPLNVPS